MTRCDVCFRHCDISEGGLGFCGVRTLRDGIVVPLNYGRVTSLALDPITKKPLNRFNPGSNILSLGSYGCNLRCPFCQNSAISWSDDAYEQGSSSDVYDPGQIADLAVRLKPRGNIGVAYTYNEPLIAYEFVRDTAKLVKERGMANVLVSNGTAELPVLEELLPYIDAMNIDLKCFDAKTYREVLGGDLEMVKAFITRASSSCHVEITTLIVPGISDSREEMRQICSFISSLPDGSSIPLHITRFFPRFRMKDREATSVEVIRELASIAGETLKYVYIGNC